jgi:site-specific recombinase XerD
MDKGGRNHKEHHLPFKPAHLLYLQLEAGTDSRTVQELVGTKNLATTQCYLDSVSSRKKEAANRITLKRKVE